MQHQGGTLRFAYDAAERLISAESADGVTLAYTYDGVLPLGTTWSGPVSGNVTRTYDENFFVTSISVGDSAVTYAYDDDGLITRAGTLQLTHDPSNALLTATSAGDLDANFTYSPRAELTSHTVTGDGATPLYAASYTHDALGRIATVTETLEGTSTTLEYTYDPVGQLIRVSTNGAISAEYTYDPDGNRLTLQTGGTTLQATYDAQERLLTQGDTAYSYTPRGTLQTRIAGGATTTYTYDPLGNLSAVTLPDARAITYLTDAQNRRVAKLINGTLQRAWIYQNTLEPIAELDPTGAVTARFVYASKSHVPDLMIQGATTYALITDLRGSVRLVVNTATSEVAQRIDYGPFGEVIADTNPGFQPFGFAGGLYDPDTGLVRFGARDYDAQSGRWTNKDPIGFGGGQANLYAYVGNDPVNRIDPDGQFLRQIFRALTGLRKGARLSPAQARSRLRNGGDVMASSKEEAEALARQYSDKSGGGGNVAEDAGHLLKSGGRGEPHFHGQGPQGRLPGHIFWDKAGGFLMGVFDTNDDGVIDGVDLLNLASPFGNVDAPLDCGGA